MGMGTVDTPEQIPQLQGEFTLIQLSDVSLCSIID